MSYHVYALKSARDGRLYVGMSQDVHKRFEDHLNGRVFSTKGYRPWELVFTEEVGPDRTQARNREKYLKSGAGKEYLRLAITTRKGESVVKNSAPR